MIAEKYNLNFVDSGSMLRESAETELGKKAKEYTDKGIYVPEELYFQILKKYIDEHTDKSKGYVFTGFPRTLEQIPFMENVLRVKLDKVVELVVSPEEYMKRIQKRIELEHRADETPEAINLRLEQHIKKTGPVLDYFRKQGIVAEVNGEGSIEDIFERIILALN